MKGPGRPGRGREEAQGCLGGGEGGPGPDPMLGPDPGPPAGTSTCLDGVAEVCDRERGGHFRGERGMRPRPNPSCTRRNLMARECHMLTSLAHIH